MDERLRFLARLLEGESALSLLLQADCRIFRRMPHMSADGASRLPVGRHLDNGRAETVDGAAPRTLKLCLNCESQRVVEIAHCSGRA